MAWDPEKESAGFDVVGINTAINDQTSRRSEQNPNDNEGLHQKLNTRHLTFISLGSVIGSGIFLGIGSALTTAGPVGLALAFAFICSVVYCVMLCTGEMVTYLPVVAAHMRLSGRFVDTSLAAAMSWNYWYCWSLISAAEPFRRRGAHHLLD